MLEELYRWDGETRKRWGSTRALGKWRYILIIGAWRMGGLAAVAFSAITLLAEGRLTPLPWEVVILQFTIWPLAGSVAASVRWSLNERCFWNPTLAPTAGRGDEDPRTSLDHG